MNWLLIATIFVILACVLHGFKKGFLRVIFSLIAIFIVLLFVSFATPYISTYIEKNTSIYATIQKNCETYLEHSGTKAVTDTANGSNKAQSTLEANLGKSQKDTVNSIKEQVIDLKLPETIQQKIIKDTTSVANTILDESGLYKTMSQSLAHIIVSGISFFIAFILGIILINIISVILDIVSHVPILHGINKLAGGVAGIIEGFVFVWIFLYLVALLTSTAFGKLMVDYINQSVFLSYLYHNNALLQIGGNFMWR